LTSAASGSTVIAGHPRRLHAQGAANAFLTPLAAVAASIPSLGLGVRRRGGRLARARRRGAAGEKR
jgi:hypothetical protein